MQASITRTAPPVNSGRSSANSALGAAVIKLSPPALRGAWTLPIVSFVVYLFVIHSFKVNAAQEALIIGLVSVILFARPLRISPALGWYTALLAWELLTLPASPIVSTSWDAWVVAFKVWLIMFLIYNAVRTHGQARLVALAWLAMFAFYPVRGTLFNFASGISHAGRYGWNFTFANFNDLAAITIMPLALTVDRLRSAESKWIKVCALAGLLAMPFIILITQSRGGMLGLAAFFLFMVARSRQRIRMIVSLALIGFGALMFAPQSVWDRITGMKSLRSTEALNEEADGSAQQRWMIMHVAATIAADHPIFGVGTGAYRYMHGLATQGRSEWALAGGERDSHNTYLHVAAENGIIGLVLYMMIFVSTYNELRKTARAVKGSTDPTDRELGDRCQAYQAALIGLAVCGIFGSLNTISFPFMFVILANVNVRLPRALSTPAIGNRVAKLPLPTPKRLFRGGWRPQPRRATIAG